MRWPFHVAIMIGVRRFGWVRVGRISALVPMGLARSGGRTRARSWQGRYWYAHAVRGPAVGMSADGRPVWRRLELDVVWVRWWRPAA
jgi:hypothetical protein